MKSTLSVQKSFYFILCECERKKEKKKRKSQKLSKWRVVKVVGSGKLESRIDKGDTRDKKGRLKKKKRKTWTWNFDPFNFWIRVDQ